MPICGTHLERDPIRCGLFHLCLHVGGSFPHHGAIGLYCASGFRTLCRAANLSPQVPTLGVCSCKLGSLPLEPTLHAARQKDLQ